MDLTAVMATLGNLVLERLPDGRFRRCGRVPSWCKTLGVAALDGEEPFLLDEVFPFLAVFLPDAEASWRAARPSRVDSGFWTEKATGDERIHLEATAVLVDSRAVLVVKRNERVYAQKELLLQRARELRLTHGSLVHEIEQKDVLIHAIVHDLAAPLHSILGALSLMAEQPVGADNARWVQIALQAAVRQRQLISDILDVFSADYGLLTGVPDPAAAPDLGHAIAQVVAQAGPAAHAHGAAIEAVVPPGRLRVVAEEARLVRVLFNLVENALRHSPAGGHITISAERRERAVRVLVDDEGPGVPAEMLSHLFERFAGGARVAGTGLGLYFCRITVERWGGGIGYERRQPVGSRFWLRLVDADAGGERGQAIGRG
jgi:signal transduction histidine kinase